MHRRRSIRLHGYDYRQAGAYFVTICVQDRACLFGSIERGVMVPSDAGRMVQSVWDDLPTRYPGVERDAFVVMPNHVHGILVLANASPAPLANAVTNAVGAGPCACPSSASCACPSQRTTPDRGRAAGMSLPDVVQRFKSLTTTLYRRGVNERGWEPFHGRLWQRNYYEHIIRDDRALETIRAYILTNPERWDTDQLHPNNPSKW